MLDRLIDSLQNKNININISHVVNVTPAHIRINLQNMKLNSLDAKLLSDDLPSTTFPLYLNLSCNNIGSNGAVHLFDLLPSLAPGSQLNLCKNKITNIASSSIPSKKLNAIHLNLSSNQISEEGMLNVIHFIPYLPPYSKLDLSVNFISESAIDLLTQILKDAPHHFELNLSNTHIDENGILALTTAIACNTPAALKLILQNNCLVDESAEYFAKILHKMPVNFNLDLSSNYITSVGASGLAKSLKAAPKGFSLNLANNEIDNSGAEEILKELKEELPKDLVIKLDRNYFDSTYHQDISQAILLNDLRHALISCMQLYYGANETKNFLHQIPVDVLKIIYGNIMSIPTINTKHDISMKDVMKYHLSFFKNSTAGSQENANHHSTNSATYCTPLDEVHQRL